MMKSSDELVEANHNPNWLDIPKDPKFKVGDHISISKQKDTFANGYTPNWSE